MNPYIDSATGTHFNKLGIVDADLLHLAEYHITNLRVAELALKPIPGRFDLDHLRAVHRHVFSDIYDWAGQIRTVDISKRDPAEPAWTSPFAPAQHIRPLMADLANDIAAWGNLRRLDTDDFAGAMTLVYVRMNYVHPFPEGNGRSTQTLLSQLAREAGYDIDYSRLDKHDWNLAAARSMPQRRVSDPTQTRRGDAGRIHAAFKRIVTPIRQVDRPSDRDRGA